MKTVLPRCSSCEELGSLCHDHEQVVRVYTCTHEHELHMLNENWGYCEVYDEGFGHTFHLWEISKDGKPQGNINYFLPSFQYKMGTEEADNSYVLTKHGRNPFSKRALYLACASMGVPVKMER